MAMIENGTADPSLTAFKIMGTPRRGSRLSTLSADPQRMREISRSSNRMAERNGVERWNDFGLFACDYVCF
jgi:hypothetical protein